MNIFRVLAQGDGSINEPNVSAFLGYLLNPGEDHGLDSLFLEEFLYQHYCFCKSVYDEQVPQSSTVKKTKEVKDPFAWLNDDFRTGSKYEIKVFFEQAFKNVVEQKSPKSLDDPKDVVDLILVIYDVGDDNSIEQKFQNYISNNRQLKHIFLIEVKIRDSACKDGKDNREGQLENQIKKSRALITSILQKQDKNFDVKDKISAIFVTPGSERKNAELAFEHSFNNSEIAEIPKSHIFWNFPKIKKAEFNFDFNKGKLNAEYVVFEDHINGIKDENDLSNPKSIENILDDLLYPRESDKQQPIPQYTLDTIKSFSNYLYSDFSYKLKAPKKYNTKPFVSIRELREKIPAFTSPAIFDLLEESAELIKKNLKGEIKNINSFGTNHVISLWLKRKFADITKRGTYILFRFLFDRYPNIKPEIIKKKVTTIVSAAGLKEVDIKKDDNSFYFEINEDTTAKQILNIARSYLKLSESLLDKTED